MLAGSHGEGSQEVGGEQRGGRGVREREGIKGEGGGPWI